MKYLMIKLSIVYIYLYYYMLNKYMKIIYHKKYIKFNPEYSLEH